MSTTPTNSQTATLDAAKEAGARVEFAVRFGAISVGWCLFCIGASAWVLPYDVWPVQFFSLMPMWPSGGAVMLLSVRPVDKIGTLIASSLVQLATFWFAFNILSFFLRANDPTLAPVGVIGFVNLVCGLVLFRNYLVHPNFQKAGGPRVRLNRIWRSYRIFCGFMSLFFLTAALGNAGLLPGPPLDSSGSGSGAPATAPAATLPPGARPASARGGDFTNTNFQVTESVPEDVPGAFICALVALFVAFGLRPAVRRKVHSYLGGLAAKGEAKAAAAVAGLVGGRSPQEALKHGTETFRALPLQNLSLTDLVTSQDTGLHQKTVKASLGEVHAFLSHSWHDEAQAKWNALSAWGTSKSAPLLWLDKVRFPVASTLAGTPSLTGDDAYAYDALPIPMRRVFCVHEPSLSLSLSLASPP